MGHHSSPPLLTDINTWRGMVCVYVCVGGEGGEILFFLHGRPQPKRDLAFNTREFFLITVSYALTVFWRNFSEVEDGDRG